MYYYCDDDSDSMFSVIQLLGRLYQVVNGAPGFEAKTKDDTFWVPIAHSTHSATHARLKSTNIYLLYV